MSKLVIIDFSNLAFKSFYGVKAAMTSPSGFPTNAIYGFWHSLFKIIETTNPTHLVACMEGKDRANNPRKLLFPDYKANRSAPDSIKIQLPVLEEQLKECGIFCLRIEPYEADDSIASLMVQGQEHFDEIIVFSVDKDLLQFVNHRTYLMDVSAMKKMDEDFVRGKYQLSPSQILDYLSITGDAADNIPGIPGVGPKGAQQVLSKYGSVDNFLAKEVVSSKAETLILEHREKFKAAKALVKVYHDLPLPTWESLRFSFMPSDELKESLEDLKLKSVLDRLYFFEDIKKQGE